MTITLPTKQHYESLTPEEAEHFLTKGWLQVKNAIKPEYIDKWMADFWTRLGYDENDKSTWKEEYVHLPRHREAEAEEFAPEAWKKICDIVGGEDKIDPVRERYYGDAFIINFGNEERTHEAIADPRSKKNWHVDDDWYRMFLDSAGNALTVIHCFTDILPNGGGGTMVCEDGMTGILQTLYEHPEGFDPPISPPSGNLCKHVPDCSQFSTVTAKKGDVILLHGLVPHTNSYNYLHYPRVISNPHVALHSPHNLNRPDGNYTLLEQVILRNLGRESIPEFKPTRERMSWYPRNAGFKQAKIKEELARMIAAAKAKGLDESAVDSVHLRGEEAIREMDRRNGFDKPLPDSGLLMAQHGA